MPKPDPWKAPALAADLCSCLVQRGWITVREIALNDHLTHRGDVVAMLVSGRVNRVDIYELKVSRGDLLADLRREKWRAYLKHGAVWFALPQGLADPREIPIEAGVIVRRQDGWRQVRAPRPFVGQPSVGLMRRLVMAVRSQTAGPPEPRKAQAWAAERRARTDLGRRICKVAGDLELSAKLAEEKAEEVRMLNRQIVDLERRLRSLQSDVFRSERQLPLAIAGR